MTAVQVPLLIPYEITILQSMITSLVSPSVMVRTYSYTEPGTSEDCYLISSIICIAELAYLIMDEELRFYTSTCNLLQGVYPCIYTIIIKKLYMF